MTVCGIGIHSGSSCRVSLHRSEGPVRFLRNGVTIRATVDRVASADRCTILASGGEQVAMVEHLLAALHVTGWWRGVTIECTAAELPILDGSAEPWLEAIDALGAPPSPPSPIVIEDTVELVQGPQTIRATPGAPSIACDIDFEHPAIGRQRWLGAPPDYPELLPARTFGFLAEAEALRKAGLARGAGADNAVVFADDGPLLPLRSPDEPVRHKALDLLGDLFLLERPVSGRVAVTRGSHALHIAFAARLGRTYGPCAEVLP